MKKIFINLTKTKSVFWRNYNAFCLILLLKRLYSALAKHLCNYSVCFYIVCLFRKISARANVGPCCRVCARETLRSAPINMSEHFPAHLSAESPSNISPNPLEVISKVSEV